MFCFVVLHIIPYSIRFVKGFLKFYFIFLFFLRNALKKVSIERFLRVLGIYDTNVIVETHKKEYQKTAKILSRIFFTKIFADFRQN